MFKQFRYPSSRTAITIAIASGALLFVLVILWLATSTRTALLNRQLDEYDIRAEQLMHESSLIWKQIGEITTPQEMDRRMREAGFSQPAGMEFLVPVVMTTTTTFTTTKPVSTTVSLGVGNR